MPENRPVASAPVPEPISPEQLREISLADERERRFSSALSLATLNGWGLSICAVLALMSGLFDVVSWVLAAALGALAYVELRGRRMLAGYDRRALTWLARNQIALILLVWGYCLSRIYVAQQGANPLTELMLEHPELGDALADSGVGADVATYYRQAVVGLYSLVMVVTAVVQGGCALYYATRRKHLDEFLARTPSVVVEWKRSRARYRG